ncbi:MAG: cytochrome C [Gemmatimonadetes bacterium]|nr:cytochrome C [Gemmatimonadota bacterium]
MFRSRHLALAVACFLPTALLAQDKPKVTAASPEAAGEYLMIVGSCHDCHTAGWTESKGKIAKDDQLTGNPVGFKGPWGTVYGKNLRTIAARQSEDHWVHVLQTADGGEGDLPMPWHNTAMMTEEDLRNLYKYTKSLGAKVGARIPRNAKPGMQPQGQYIDLSTQGAAAPADTTKKP